jgi:hypothetical protein
LQKDKQTPLLLCVCCLLYVQDAKTQLPSIMAGDGDSKMDEVPASQVSLLH